MSKTNRGPDMLFCPETHWPDIADYITIVRIYVLRQNDNISGYCADLAYIFMAN